MKTTLTIPEAAKRIPIGESTLRRYIRRKQITVIVLPGGDQRIDEDDLDDFLNSRKIPRKKWNSSLGNGRQRKQRQTTTDFL